MSFELDRQERRASQQGRRASYDVAGNDPMAAAAAAAVASVAKVWHRPCAACGAKVCVIPSVLASRSCLVVATLKYGGKVLQYLTVANVLLSIACWTSTYEGAVVHRKGRRWRLREGKTPTNNAHAR